MWRSYAAADIYLQTPGHRQHALLRARSLRERLRGRLDGRGGVPAILTSDVHGLLVSCNDDERAATPCGG